MVEALWGDDSPIRRQHALLHSFERMENLSMEIGRIATVGKADALASRRRRGSQGTSRRQSGLDDGDKGNSGLAGWEDDAEFSFLEDDTTLDMEDHLVKSCKPEPIDLKLLAMLGPDGEAKLSEDYERIFEYFRHKSVLMERKATQRPAMADMNAMRRGSAMDADTDEEEEEEVKLKSSRSDRRKSMAASAGARKERRQTIAPANILPSVVDPRGVGGKKNAKTTATRSRGPRAAVVVPVAGGVLSGVSGEDGNDEDENPESPTSTAGLSPRSPRSPASPSASPRANRKNRPQRKATLFTSEGGDLPDDAQGDAGAGEIAVELPIVGGASTSTPRAQAKRRR